MDLVLQPRALPDDLRAACDLPAQRQCGVVRHPDLGQETRGIKLCQNGRVDLVRLDARLGDQTDFERVGDDDPSRPRLERRNDGGGVAGRLKHNMVVLPEGKREALQLGVKQRDAPAGPNQAVLQVRHLGERS